MANNAIRTTLSKIMLNKIVPSTILGSKKDKAVVYQDIVREYAGARGNDSMQMSIAPSDAFGKGETYTSRRSAFVSIPKGATEATVQAWLDKLSAEAVIYAVMSNDIMDVLTEEEISQLPTDEAERSARIAKYCARHEMQNANGDCFLSGDGKFQFRRNFLNVGQKDVDKRSVKTSQTVAYRNKNKQHVNYLTGELTDVQVGDVVEAGSPDTSRPDEFAPVAPAPMTVV